MKQTMREKQSKVILKAAILSTATIAYFGGIITPVLGEIALAYPGTNQVVIRSIATIPSIMLVIFSFISERLCRVMSKRNVLLLATGFVFAGGIMPAFYGGIYFILATRLIYGIGYGLGYPLAVASIVDYIKSEERARLMGYSTAVGALSGILFQILGGIVALFYWRYAFLCYALILVVAILVYLGFPDEKSKDIQTKINRTGNKEKKLTTATYFVSLVSFLSSIVLWTLYTNLSIVFATEHMANSADSAIILSLFSLMMAVTGIIFGKFLNIFNNHTGVIGILLFGAGFIIIASAKSFYLFIIAIIIMGIGYGMYLPAMQLAIGNSASKQEYTTLAISLRACCMGMGQFLSPYTFALITNILGISGGRAEWKVATVMCFAGAVIAEIVMKFYKEHAKHQPI